eukprot:5337580-Amphidinium_carterae.1
MAGCRTLLALFGLQTQQCVHGVVVSQNRSTYLQYWIWQNIGFAVVSEAIQHRVHEVHFLLERQVCANPHRPVLFRVLGRQPHEHIVTRKQFK